MLVILSLQYCLMLNTIFDPVRALSLFPIFKYKNYTFIIVIQIVNLLRITAPFNVI